jgi:hypothetical protein
MTHPCGEKILQERLLPAFAIKFLSTSLLREHREHTIPLLSILLKASNKMTTTFKLAGLRCTFIQAKQGKGESLRVVLPNGRNVVVYSKEGANEFVDTVGTDFISTNLKAQDAQKLTFAYSLMAAVAEHASTEKIASGIPESELRTFIKHTLNTLKTLSTDRNWLRSGTVSECHVSLLQTVACFTKHSSFLKIFLFNEGMETVAKFYAARKKNKTPSKIVAQLIVSLVNNSLCAFEQEGVSDEKAFSTIEKTGLLGQFIRCVPIDPEGSAEIVTCLLTCPQLVKKKLKSETPTGDILDAVIAGKDGPIKQKAKFALTKLQGLARLSNFDQTCVNMCGHCKKPETMNGAKLMKCQRCKAIYYCSKECQVADWKGHKRMCKEISSNTVSRSARKTSISTMRAFVSSNYIDIAKEVYKKTQEFNVPKKKLVVEINFYGDAPALQNKFKVWLTSGVLEGSSVADAPDWFHAGADKKALPRLLREEYERVTSDQLLAVCLTGNGMVAVQILQIANPEGCQLLSDEAVESIGKEDYVRMVACLGQLQADKYLGTGMA